MRKASQGALAAALQQAQFSAQASREQPPASLPHPTTKPSPAPPRHGIIPTRNHPPVPTPPSALCGRRRRDNALSRSFLGTLSPKTPSQPLPGYIVRVSAPHRLWHHVDARGSSQCPKTALQAASAPVAARSDFAVLAIRAPRQNLRTCSWRPRRPLWARRADCRRTWPLRSSAAAALAAWALGRRRDRRSAAHPRESRTRRWPLGTPPRRAARRRPRRRRRRRRSRRTPPVRSTRPGRSPPSLAARGAPLCGAAAARQPARSAAGWQPGASPASRGALRRDAVAAQAGKTVRPRPARWGAQRGALAALLLKAPLDVLTLTY